MKSEKRKIKSYKGGRTAEFHIRIKPDSKKAIKDMAEKKDVTMADLIEEWADYFSKKGI